MDEATVRRIVREELANVAEDLGVTRPPALPDASITETTMRRVVELARRKIAEDFVQAIDSIVLKGEG